MGRLVLVPIRALLDAWGYKPELSESTASPTATSSSSPSSVVSEPVTTGSSDPAASTSTAEQRVNESPEGISSSHGTELPSNGSNGGGLKRLRPDDTIDLPSSSGESGASVRSVRRRLGEYHSPAGEESNTSSCSFSPSSSSFLTRSGEVEIYVGGERFILARVVQYVASARPVLRWLADLLLRESGL